MLCSIVLLSGVVILLPYNELFYYVGLATTFEEAWSTLGDALKAAAQVLRGSPLIELWRNPSATNGDVTDIKSDNEYREALKKDKVRIGHEQTIYRTICLFMSD